LSLSSARISQMFHCGSGAGRPNRDSRAKALPRRSSSPVAPSEGAEPLRGGMQVACSLPAARKTDCAPPALELRPLASCEALPRSR